MSSSERGWSSDRRLLIWQIWLSTLGVYAAPFALALGALYFWHVSTRSYFILILGLMSGAALWALGLILTMTRRSARSARTLRRDGLSRLRALEPPPPALFVGRGEELKIIQDYAKHHITGDGTPRIVVLYGDAGAGKTSLANHVARDLQRRHPGGHVFLHLEPEQDQARAVESLLGSLYSRRGSFDANRDGTVPGQSPLDPRKASKVLFVLDGAVGSSALEPLMAAGSSNTVLLTTRARLSSRPDVLQIHVGPLTATDAVELLSALVGSERVAGERDAADQLVQAVGYQPLAIRLIGASLADDPYGSLASALAQMQRIAGDEIAEAASQSALDLSALALTALERRALTLLGLFDKLVFAPWMLGAVLDADEPEVLRVVDALTRARLIEQFSLDTGTALFRIHEEVHQYCAQLLLTSTSAAERRALHARIALAREQSKESEFVQRVDERVRHEIGEGDFASARQAARDLTVFALSQGDQAKEAQAKTVLAAILIELGSLNEAEQLAHSALEIDEPVSARRAMHCLGVLMHRKKQFAAASDYFTKARSMASDEPDVQETSSLISDLALLQAESTQSSEAQSTMETAIGMAKGPVDHDVLMVGLVWAQCRVMRLLGHREESVTLLTTERRVAEDAGFALWQARLDHELALCMLDDGDYAAAETFAARALAGFTRMQHRYAVAQCRLTIGQAASAGAVSRRRRGWLGSGAQDLPELRRLVAGSGYRSPSRRRPRSGESHIGCHTSVQRRGARLRAARRREEPEPCLPRSYPGTADPTTTTARQYHPAAEP